MATIVDVAKKAGVSVSTVSYTMSGARPISAATRQRVLQAIEDLNYHPNKLARGLASKRTRIIALLYPKVVSGFLDDIQLDFISSIANITSHYNYSMLLSTAHFGELDILRFINEKIIDGLILMEVQVDDPRVRLMKELDYPFSLIGHCQDCEGTSFVDLDFFAALRLSALHLADLNHRQIAFIPATDDPAASNCTYILESMRGFTTGADERGICGIIRGSRPTTQDAYAVMNSLLNDYPELSGVVAGNDPVYSGVVQALHDKGLNIPIDFSTIGIISQQMAGKYTPKVTSLTIPSTEMGRLGAELLIARLEGHESGPQQVMLAPELSIRQSTGPWENSRGYFA